MRVFTASLATETISFARFAAAPGRNFDFSQVA